MATISYSQAVKGDTRFGFSGAGSSDSSKSSSGGSTPGPIPGFKINSKGQATDSAGNLSNDRGPGAAPNPIAPIVPVTPQTPTIPNSITPTTNSPQAALKDAQASGPAPQEAGVARAAIANFSPAVAPTFYKPYNPANPNDQTVYDSTGKALDYNSYIAAGGKTDFSNVQQGLPDTSQVDQQLNADPNFQKILADQQAFNDITKQQQSLTDTYTKLTKQLGIPALNTQLMNMKNIIDGTPDDIRQEITKAGGFATESQVLALSSARNKTLIQNYNNLLNVKQQAQDTLNTMMGLAEKDKSLALSSISQRLQIDTQIYEFSQKATANAQSAYKGIIDKVGYAGLYAMTNNNPFYSGMVEKTLGLNTGALAQLAQQSNTGGKLLSVAEAKSLGVPYGTTQQEAASMAITPRTGRASSGGGGSKPKVNDTADMSAALSSVKGSDGYISPEDYKTALSAWQNAGHSAASFKTNFGNFINPADPQDYK